MTSTIINHDTEPWRERLYLPAYRVGEAARYVGATAQTISYWQRGSRTQRPALQERPPRRYLSYYELVEVAFVAIFRKLGVSLKRIRDAREYAADVLKAEYPFAEYKWFTEGHRVLLNLQELDGTGPIGHLVAADAHGQIGWQELVADRFSQFDYEQDIALVWHVAGRESPVKIDPRMSFGTPTVKGLPTWVLKDRHEAGESIPSISEDYGLSEEDVRHGLDFEGVESAS